MTVPDFPANRENARLHELERLCVLAEEADPDFDVIAQATATIFDMPVALVSIVGEHRLWFRTTDGLRLPQTLRVASFCAYAIEALNCVLVVPDTTLDTRFARHPLVTHEPHARFYAGAPLVSSRGFGLGTLCVLDSVPRIFNEEQSVMLQSLAALTVRLIERGAEAAVKPEGYSANESGSPGAVMFGFDEAARITSWNAAAQSLLGFSAVDVVGRVPPFIAASDRQRYARDCRAAFDHLGDVVRECRMTAKDGRSLQTTIVSTCLVDGAGRICGISTIESAAARRATERRSAMFESVVVNATDALMIIESTPTDGRQNRIVYVNAAFSRMTGYCSADMIGATPQMLEGAATDRMESARIAKALRRGEAVLAELTNYRKDGSEIRVECNISPVVDDHGVCMYFLAVERDVTERRALEKYELDRSVVLEMAIRNESLQTQLGRIVELLKNVIPGSMGTVLLLEGDRLFSAAADPQISADYLAAIDGGRIGPEAGSCGTAVFHGEAVICSDIATDFRWRAYADVAIRAELRACWSIPFFADNGDALGVFALYARRAASPTPRQLTLFEEAVRFASLVVARHRDRLRLERMALRDALTGLPNRPVIEEFLLESIERAGEAGGMVAIGVLDINRFKVINDAFGHHIGDQLLQLIADRMSGALRDGDAVGRAGGDEFVVVFPDLSNASAGIDAASRLIDQFAPAFHVSGYEIFVRPSVGLAFYPQTSRAAVELLQAADKAMYLAKRRGGGLELAPAVTERSSINPLDLENHLQHALERNELTLYYQMLFDLVDGRPVGVEALLRWNHEPFGLIGPSDFIPLAEANGTIVPIGAWVIDQATCAARRWQDQGHDAFVTVNVSALQFDAGGLIETVVSALARYGLEPHRLHLELTESLIMRDPAVSATTLLRLKALGVKIVLDDFGTGYSSLAYLQRFSFDALKIDSTFVRGVGDKGLSGRSEQIIAAVVQFGHALGVTTIAEGVEDVHQFEFLRSCGCAVVQGFLFARPVPENGLRWDRWVAPATYDR